jgi:fructose-bisphosphate aldolase class II
MPLVPMVESLRRAQAQSYALPCFCAFEMLGAEGVLAALEDRRAPAIVAVYAGQVDKPHARAFVALLRELAQAATVPVSLMLDHGGSLEQCIKALAYGLTDVMFDGSSLSLEENIAQTRLVVRAAHAVGTGVEAELGHVGLGAEYESYAAQRAHFTDPAIAQRFAAETEVDALAVAIGSAHGVYKTAPQLDLELLQEIRALVDVPLSLHGGSGLSEEQFRSAIQRGIAKVNIFTDLGIVAGQRMILAAQAEKASYFSITDATRQAFRERSAYYLDVFGASGRA